jgi:hypothetical protein
MKRLRLVAGRGSNTDPEIFLLARVVASETIHPLI